MNTPANREPILILAPVGRDAALLHALLTQANYACTILDPDTPPAANQPPGVCLITQEALRPAFFATWSPLFTTQVAWSSVPLVLLVDKHQPGDLRRTLRVPLGPDKLLTILERPIPAQTLLEVLQTTIELRQQQAAVRTLLTQLTRQNAALRREVAAHQATVAALRQSEAHLQTLNATLEQRVLARTAALEERNAELDQFAYITSHDLKAPLRAIRQLTTWITQDAGAALPAASQTHLVKLQGRVQRMEHMIEDLLVYSRAGRQRYAPEPVALTPLVRAISEFLAPPPGFTIRTQPLPTLLTEGCP